MRVTSAVQGHDRVADFVADFSISVAKAGPFRPLVLTDASTVRPPPSRTILKFICRKVFS